MAEKKEKKVEKKDAVTREEFDNLCAKVRRMSDNWHKYMDSYVGSGASAGKIAGMILAVCLIGSLAVAQDWQPFDADVYGAITAVADPTSQTADLEVSGNVTVDGTLTIGSSPVSTIASNKFLIGNASDVGAAWTLSGDVTSTTSGVMSITAGVIVNADVSASAAIAQSKLVTAGLGAAVAGTTTVSEVASPYVETVVTITNLTLVATDGSDEGDGQKIFDADAGAFLIGLSVANMTCVSSAGATNVFVLACGTAKAGDDATLTGTEANVIPSTSLDTTGGTVLTNAFDAIVAAPIILDGTSAAVDLYVNFAIVDADMDANVTNTITGTLTILTTRAVDN